LAFVDDEISGRTEIAMVRAIAELSHGQINDLGKRFEVELSQLRKSDKARSLVQQIASRRPDYALDELLFYLLEFVYRGTYPPRPGAAELRMSLLEDAIQMVDDDKNFETKPPHPNPSAINRDSEVESHVSPGSRRTIFLVQGRDNQAAESMKALLRAFDLKVIEWRQASSYAGGGTPPTLDIVRAGMNASTAVVVLMTPDDVGYVRPVFYERRDGRHEAEPTGQARLNVVFEAGMAMALDASKVVIVEIGEVRSMSDTQGLNVIRMNDTIPRRRDLASRLEAAGLEVETDNEDWRTAGSFNPADLEPVDLMPSKPLALLPPSRSDLLAAAEHAVLKVVAEFFSEPGANRLNVPFEVEGFNEAKVKWAVKYLYEAEPPYIDGVTAEEADYPIIITRITERGRREARLPLSKVQDLNN
jgi:predicted nucleotide-binding protein